MKQSSRTRKNPSGNFKTRKDKQTDSLEEKEQDPFHVFAILTSPLSASFKRRLQRSRRSTHNRVRESLAKTLNALSVI